MATGQELFAELSRVIRGRVPKFTNRWKSDVLLYKVIGPVMEVFNKGFRTRYITTVYPHVDWPEQNPEQRDHNWETLAHEYVHLLDLKRMPVRFVFAYGFPQILAPLALLALLAFWSKWWLLSLLFLGCAAPLPAPGRAWAELRGYTMSLAVIYWQHGEIWDGVIDWIAPQFTGWSYYRMGPSDAKVRAHLARSIEAIKDGSILLPEENAAFRDVYAMVQRSKAQSAPAL